MISRAIGASANAGRRQGALRAAQPVRAEEAHIGQPRIVPLVESAQRLGRGSRETQLRGRAGRQVEMRDAWWPEHGQQVTEPPGDRGDGLREDRLIGTVDGEVAGADRDRVTCTFTMMRGCTVPGRPGGVLSGVYPVAMRPVSGR
jgi:hypothetical protein